MDLEWMKPMIIHAHMRTMGLKYLPTLILNI